jgi:M6 family metalloprotease-like protein
MNGFLKYSSDRLRISKTKSYLMKIIGLQLFLWFFFSSQLSAVTAYPHPIEYTQPDGTAVTIRMMGDEKVHWAETMDYYSLLANGLGGWEYAVLDGKGDMVPSGILATNPENRSIVARNLLFSVPKSLRFSIGQVQILQSFWDQDKSGEKAFVPTGNKNLVMILVAYTDRAFTRTQAEFNNLMNQIGYNLGGAQGSVKDFFLENSYNTFNITTTVVGPYTLSNNMAYYGANVSGNDVRPREMVTEAVNLADAAVNYANFDNDGDGTVDGVYVIYAGFGEEAGGGANCIWAHAWAIPTINRDGVNINRYSCSAELRGNSGTNISTIGVICHEFGHVCGAPDYYDTNYGTGGQYDGTGNWDLMASGSWNGINAAGDCPAHVNGYQKWLYGWAHPTLLSVQQAVSLQSSALHDEFCYYTTHYCKRIFLLRKQAAGWL